MRKTDLVIGMLIGIAGALLGSYLFIVIFTEYAFVEGIRLVKFAGNLGKVITLGAILNLILFFGLLHFKKELMAKGVVLATILLTIVTLFV
ncbi:MAG: hypothetical protein ITG00_03680 [Flavobacterium sp.]|nr:hypothetical protein [Flavobacterium sp.]